MGQKAYVIPYPDGSTYEGDCLDALPHGKGIIKYADGSLVMGIFEKGKITQCKLELKDQNNNKILQYKGAIQNK